MDSHPADVTEDRFARENGPDASNDAYAGALFGAIAVLVAVDVGLDLASGAEIGHIGVEVAVFAAAAAGLLWLWRRFRANRVLARTLRRDLASARADAARFREESQALLAGLGAAIDRQFTFWSLSGAEREVGLLLLKGLSLKEIADVRGTSERTVRQQAFAVYRKARVAGRAELSAFFLEDLLLPPTPAAPQQPRSSDTPPASPRP